LSAVVSLVIDFITVAEKLFTCPNRMTKSTLYFRWRLRFDEYNECNAMLITAPLTLETFVFPKLGKKLLFVVRFTPVINQHFGCKQALSTEETVEICCKRKIFYEVIVSGSYKIANCQIKISHTIKSGKVKR